jgi:hypothetical protein
MELFNGRFEKTHTWYKFLLPIKKACCSEGSRFPVYLKKGNSNNLIVMFSGGGISWNEVTAANPTTLITLFLRNSGFYFPKVGIVEEITKGGILKAQDVKNPFNDWNIISVPYSTGDFHIGNNDYPYTDERGKQRILHHCGAHNVATVLEATNGLFAQPDKLLICGESAGGFGCIAQAENIIWSYPECSQITVFSDSAGGSFRHWKEIVRDVWKADRELWECIQSPYLNLDWFTLLYRKFGNRIKYLNSCSYHDGTLTSYQKAMKNGKKKTAVDPDGLAEFYTGLIESQKNLLQEIPGFRCYISDWNENKKTGATAHCALGNKLFHKKNSTGNSLADCLDDAVNQAKLYNVGLDLLEKSL